MSDDREKRLLERRAEELARQSLRPVPKWEEGAEQWCTGNWHIAERGADSYGDCADCGEPLIWVVPA